MLLVRLFGSVLKGMSSNRGSERSMLSSEKTGRIEGTGGEGGRSMSITAPSPTSPASPAPVGVSGLSMRSPPPAALAEPMAEVPDVGVAEEEAAVDAPSLEGVLEGAFEGVLEGPLLAAAEEADELGMTSLMLGSMRRMRGSSDAPEEAEAPPDLEFDVSGSG